MFNKRKGAAPQSNIRKRKIDESEEQDDDDVVDYDRLKAIQESQESRVRKHGVTTEELAQVSKEKKALGKDEERTVEGMMGTQFSVTVDHGLGTTIPHQRIMEQYINEKLGLNKPKQAEKAKTIEDEIYQMPAELKVTSGVSEKKKPEQDEEVATRWSTGIAEVALPSKFKQRNIAETEKLAKKRQAEDYLRQSTASSSLSSVGYSRFQLPDQSFKGYKDTVSSALMSTTDDTFLAGAAQAANFLEQESLANAKAAQNSTDDKVMKRFIQRLHSNQR
eukprot:gene29492-35597_t